LIEKRVVTGSFAFADDDTDRRVLLETRILCVNTCKFGVAAVMAVAIHLSSASAQDVSFGDRLFHEKADCQFCHGPDGDGRGDPRSPGRAANLHETILNRAQLIEVIACGRPATEMPHFDKYAYEDSDCYGLKGKALGNDAPRDPHSTPLTKREIEAVADYIIKTFVGK
jgi:mono/diheme cytochrome c family protein